MLLMSFFVQLSIPIVGVTIETAKVLCAIILFFAFSSEVHIFLVLHLNSFNTFPLLSVSAIPIASSIPKCLYVSPSSTSLMLSPLILSVNVTVMFSFPSLNDLKSAFRFPKVHAYVFTEGGY